jgi:DNA helicase-2/ATP-dependent DNA helicase PcrA
MGEALVPTLLTDSESLTPHKASDSQRAAIEAEMGPVLVLAGPGAGKTFCLIERIRFLIDEKKLAPERICAFTFTNKAAGEISARLEKYLGDRAKEIKRGTIHSFCAELLREFPQHAGLQPGFGVANDTYQLTVLRRLGVPEKFRGSLLRDFTSLRFVEGFEMRRKNWDLYNRYLDFLKIRNLVDFDQLVMKAADLLRLDEVSGAVTERWESVLVDEFQDLTPVQYSVIHTLAKKHRNIFAVGDDEQSIYAWAGANPQVFRRFLNDFSLVKPTSELAENRRCPREVLQLARKIINHNTPIFEHRNHAESGKACQFPIDALKFANGDEELRWAIADILDDRERHGLSWGSYALLYRTNDMGNAAESIFLSADVPCRMASGRALSDHPVIRCVIAALRVIGNPGDPVSREQYLQEILPRTLFDRVVRKAEAKKRELLPHLEHTLRNFAREDEDATRLKKAINALKSLDSLGARHDSLSSLVNELLSKRIGLFTSFLEDNHDELSDPASNPEVETIAMRLDDALKNRRPVWIPRMDGVEIGIKGMLKVFGIAEVKLGGSRPPNAIGFGSGDCTSLGIAAGIFKAMQLIRSREFGNQFRNFTAIDTETTDRDIDRAEVVQIAAVRVRNGRVVDEFMSYVKPDGPMSAGAFDTHHIGDHELMDAKSFDEVWPSVCEFCGSDMLVAHNGHCFDFPILQRLVGPEFRKFTTFDTLAQAEELRTGSLSLANLARAYGIRQARPHDALDDTRVLAEVCLALGEEKVARSRKTCLDNLLDYLGISLALCDGESLCVEAERLRQMSRFYSLGRYTPCLDFYRDEYAVCTDAVIPDVDELISRLGGEALRERICSDKTADERYPDVMMRLRPLLSGREGTPLNDQITALLERITLSRWEGVEVDAGRVNLLTLHSTKGLEFSRVYIVGTDDRGFTRNDKKRPEDVEELRRLLYVGMTRTIDRLVLTCAESRDGRECGGHVMLDELGLTPTIIS